MNSKSDDHLLKSIGINIRRLRGFMSQDKLAKKAGVSRSTIQAIEGGKSIGLDKLLRIAKALEVNPADLLLSEKDKKEITYKAKLFWDQIKIESK